MQAMREFHKIEEQFRKDLEAEINKILNTTTQKKDDLLSSALELRL